MNVNGNPTKKEYIVMLLFLSMCGNVAYGLLPFIEYGYVIVSIILLCIFSRKYNVSTFIRLNTSWYKSVVLMISTFIVLFVAQLIVFQWNTFPGLINHLSKFFVGACAVLLFGRRFPFVYFKTLYFLALICIPLWGLQQFIGGIGGLKWQLGSTIWLYCYRDNSDIVRNCGFFWEPGAMGGYLVLAAVMYINKLDLLFHYYKKECVVLILFLLTTQSTGGYLSFFFVIGGYLMTRIMSANKKVKYGLLLLPIFCAAFIYIYTSSDFLQKKVENQQESAFEAEGEYNSTRLGSLLFDWHYIKKHPIIGNGLHENTRLADHPHIVRLLKEGALAGSGNGFGDVLAKWGLGYVLIYCLIFFRNNQGTKRVYKLLFLLSIAVMLQGEMFMNYPLFLALPLIDIKNLYLSQRFIYQ